MSLAVVGPDENPFFNNDFPFAPIGESSAIGVDDMLLIGTVSFVYPYYDNPEDELYQ